MQHELGGLQVRRLAVPLRGGTMSRPLSFDVPAGKVLAVVGPENSGKSALCRGLAGLSRCAGGIAKLAGTDLVPRPPERRRVGYASYRTGLIPHYSLAANMALPLESHGYDNNLIVSRVRGALRRLKLEKSRSALPASLTETERRLFALERAFIFEPALAVLDNPIRGLGGTDRRLVLDKMQRLLDRFAGPTILAMRDPREAMQMADALAVMYAGGIEQIGPAEVVYETPISVPVARATGQSNLCRGRVTALLGETCLVALEGGFELECVPDETLAVGDDTIVAFRPDMAALGIAGRHLENRFQAQINSVLYRGDVIDVRANGLARDNLWFRTMNTAQRRSLRPGSSMAVGLAVNACRALPVPETGRP